MSDDQDRFCGVCVTFPKCETLYLRNKTDIGKILINKTNRNIKSKKASRAQHVIILNDILLLNTSANGEVS